MSFVVRTFLAFALLLAATRGLAAQEAAAHLTGRVTDQTGRALVGASVRAVPDGPGAVTDREGRFILRRLRRGTTAVVVRFIGYESVTQEVGAGDDQAVTIVLRARPIDMPDLTVEGARLGQALALNQQRNSDNVRNVVDAELVGRLPDPNTADALQRLPGISIQRDQGEGRYVQLRGTAARLTSVQVDGIRVPAPEGDVRQVALDVIPSDQLAAIEVSKTLTPDMDAEAVGGQVNLVTRAPRAGRETRVATMAGGLNQLNSGGITQLNGSWGRRYGPLGVLLGGSYYKTNRASNNVEGVGEWTTLDTGEDFWQRVEFRDYLVDRQRWGFNATVDYDVNSRTNFFVRGLYNDYSDFEYRRRMVHRFDDGTVTATSATTFDVTGFDITRAVRERQEDQRIFSIQAGGRHALPGAQLDYTLALSRAEERNPEVTIATFAASGFDASVDLADAERPGIVFTAGDPDDASAYEFDELELQNNVTRDRDLTGQLNLALPFRFGASQGAFKVGGLFRLKEKERRNSVPIYDGYVPGTLLLSEVLGGYTNNEFYCEFRCQEIGHFSDPGAIRNLIGGDAATNFELDENTTREESDPVNYDASEDVVAAYAMATLEVGRLRLIPGVRVEATSIDYRGNEVLYDAGGDYLSTAPVTGDNRYTSIFPSVNIRLGLGNETVVRGAVTTSLARPNYYDLVPYTLAFAEDEEVAFGNPALKPTRATNLDLMVERYIGSLGVVSAGAFYKRLADYIYPRTFDVVGGAYDGYEATQPVNGEAATLWGLELAIQQHFTFLPGILGRMGINANYTYTSSSAQLPDRTESDRLPGQAEHSGNVALFYEDGRFQARMAANYFGDYIDEVGESADEDRYFNDQVQVDASASFRVTPQLRVFAEAVNLTNQPLQYYRGVERRIDQTEYYRSWGLMGFRYQF